MRAVVYRGVDDLRLETLLVPAIRADELLVKVAVCGICPTDIKKIHHGTVRVGARVRGWRVGDRVALHHHVPCLACHACRHRAFAQCAQYKRTGITAGFEPAGGGYAEYARVMSFVLPGVVKIPRGNSFEEGALLEPVNTVLKAVKRLALLPGDSVLIAGQGPIGLMFTSLLAARGLRVVATDLLEPRLKLAKQFGARLIGRADAVDLAARVELFVRGRGLDAAIITAPVDAAVLQALEMIRGAGQVLVFAHTRRGSRTEIDLSKVCVDEKDLLGSYSSDFLLQKEVARIVFSRQIDFARLITHRFPLAETSTAIRLAARPTPDSLKLVIDQRGREAHGQE
ncbi:MAG: zinc-binding dehydrogenase [Verrucomicrobia bacterium]|nr:zinc-binding dehydrogenase [Verrucomicrobiota bacterium]